MTAAQNLDDLKECFYNFDHDKDGYLTVDELRHLLTNVGDPMNGQEVEEILREADPQGTGMIN